MSGSGCSTSARRARSLDYEMASARESTFRDRRVLYAKIALVALAGGLLVVGERLGVFALFAEPMRLRGALVAMGPWGYVAFLVAYAALQPFGVPGTVFILAAPMIWPWPIAFALSMAGTMAASVIGFSFARFVARDWVQERIPPRFRAYEEALARRGFLTVVTLRFIFWMPPLLHAFFGISKVCSVRTFGGPPWGTSSHCSSPPISASGCSMRSAGLRYSVWMVVGLAGGHHRVRGVDLVRRRRAA